MRSTLSLSQKNSLTVFNEPLFFLSFQDAYIESLYFFALCIKYPKCSVPSIQNVGLPNKHGDGIRVSLLKKYVFKMLSVKKEDISKWSFKQWRMELENGETLVDYFGQYRYVGIDGTECEVPRNICAKCLNVDLCELNDEDLLLLPPTRRPLISVLRSDDDFRYEGCTCPNEFKL